MHDCHAYLLTDLVPAVVPRPWRATSWPRNCLGEYATIAELLSAAGQTLDASQIAVAGPCPSPDAGGRLHVRSGS